MSYNRVPSEVVKPKKRFSFLSSLMLLFILVTVAMSAFVGFQRYQLGKEITAEKERLDEVNRQITALEKQEKIGQIYEAKSILDKAESLRTEWSQVYRDVYKHVGQKSNVKIVSLTTAEKNITLNAESNSFESVGKLLSALTQDSEAQKIIVNPFLSTVSSSGEFGNIYNFNINFTHQQASVETPVKR